MLAAMTKSHHKTPPRPPANMDGGVYIGILMIGAFGVWLIAIATGDWKQGLLGYIIAVAFLVNLSAWQVCRGKTIVGWKQSLARLPLRCVGYGTRGGKPLAAAHGSDRAKMMLSVSIATSFVAVLALTLLLFRS